MKSHLNGLPHSPQENQEIAIPPQQIKTSQLANGSIRPNNKRASPCGVGMPITNGRRHTALDSSSEKLLGSDTKNQENDSKNQEIDGKSVDKLFQMPAMLKQFKVPLHHDQSLSKTRSNSNTNESQPTSNDGGKDVESILKMMTSTLEPLTKIAATPRTEIEVQQSNKSHVYALPPSFLKLPTNSSSKFLTFDSNF